jgi:hypothetical protein
VVIGRRAGPEGIKPKEGRSVGRRSWRNKDAK